MPRASSGWGLAFAAALGVAWLAAPLRAEEAAPPAQPASPGAPPEPAPAPEPSAPPRSEAVREELREGPLVINAEEILYDEPRELVEARRNVRAEVGGIVISSDWAVLRTSTLTGVAVGKVRIEQGGDTMTAEFAAFDLRALVAVASNAELRTEATGFVVKGDTLRKTGEATYSVDGGNFTTCRCPPGTKSVPWEVDAAHADVEVDGYAVGRGVVPKVLGVPLFYLPWFVFPVKTTRQTGFLTPAGGTSSLNGFELEAPFFWAPREDTNVLVRPIYLEKRGVKGGFEVEHVFGDEGWTDGGAAGLPGDDDVDRRDPKTRYSDDRWAFWLRHEHPLGPGIRVGADVNSISDNDYVLDFQDLAAATRQMRFLESRAWGSLAGRNAIAIVEGVYFDDLQSPNDLDRDDYELVRAPDTLLAFLPTTVLGSPLRFGMDTRYTYFYQSAQRSEIVGITPVGGQFFDTGIDGLFDPFEPNAAGEFTGVDNSGDNALTQGDGLFEEGELLADHGHRVELAPKLSLPARLGPAEGIVELGLRQTLYDSDLRDTRGRTLGTVRADTRTRFSRDFRIADLPVRHVVEPKVAFALVSKQDQDRNPLFVPEPSVQMERQINGDPRLLTEDPSDRVDPQKYLEVSLGNRLFAPARAALAPSRQLAWLRLGSGYDFELGRVANVFAELELSPTEAIRIEGEIGVDPKEDQLEEARLRGEWSTPSGYGASLEYRFLRDLPQVFEGFRYDTDVFEDFDPDFSRIEQATVSGLLPVGSRLDAFATGYFSFEDSSTKSGELGFIIKSECGCWDLIPSVRRTTRPDDTRFRIEVRIAGIGLQRPSRRSVPWRDTMP